MGRSASPSGLAGDLPFTWQDVLAHVRHEVATLYGRSLPTNRIDIFGAQSGFFMLPMQLAAARHARASTVFDLAVCAAYGHAFHRLVDWHIDERALSAADALLLAPLAELYEAGLRTLAGEHSDDVNERRQAYYRLFIAAHDREMRRAQEDVIQPFSGPDILSLGDKSGPIMVLFDLADVVSPGGVGVDRDFLHASLRLLAVGLQLEDDLQDYADDFRSRNMTYPVTTALVLSGMSAVPADLTTEELGGLIRELDVDSHCHRLAAAAFARGAGLAARARWDLLANVAQGCAATSRDLAELP